MSNNEVLQIRGLKVAAPNGAILVDGIDLDLKRGEVKGLIGESGAGKSTIGLAAMGYGRNGCRIVGGEIVVNGVSLMTVDRAGREAARGARIAYVAQSASCGVQPCHEDWRTDYRGTALPRRHEPAGS